MILRALRFSALICLVTFALAALAAEPDAASDAETDTPSAPTTRATTRPTTRSSFDPIPPREALTDARYAELAAELRVAYSKPPAEWPKPNLDPGVELHELGPLPKPEFPADNPFSKEKAQLGQELFFDPRLSGSGQIACASCHDPELGWGDGRTVAFGHDRQPTKRNAPGLFTAAYGTSFFWDGRAKTLEQQAKEPILSGEEMAGKDLGSVTERLSKVPGYRERFKAAFGTEEITFERAAQAIATFERAIVRMGGFSKFDRFLRGEKDQLSDEAVRGLHLFRTDAHCLNCHNGPLLTDSKFHNVGLSYYGRKLQDLGRYNQTKDAKDVGAFRTPTLRNIAKTGPYMHNGLFELDGVLNMYNAGMPNLRPKPHEVGDPLFPIKSSHLRPLGFNRQDIADLKAFLESLSERRVRIRPERLPSDGAAPVAAAVADAAVASAQETKLAGEPKTAEAKTGEPKPAEPKPAEPKPAEAKKLSLDEFDAMRGEKDVIVLDVRTPVEFEDGHVPGAVSIDLRDRSFTEKVEKLDKTKKYIVYCAAGTRSAGAARKMAALGFPTILDFTGGWNAYGKSGKPAETGSPAAKPEPAAAEKK